MNIKIINDLKPLKLSHAKEILTLLLNKKYEFDILCVTDKVSFNPELPKHITSGFNDMILFSLANYTLNSSYIENNNLIFEAGFGEENIGSVVTVPIKSILQITHEETPLFINITATFEDEEIEENNNESPKNPFELNPRNKKFMN